MKVSFYGTRGSCPSPGKDTLKYGGNTACTLIEANNGKKLILDAGTGIRRLGDELVKQQEDIYLLVTHNHFDHIQGFPFFKPAFQAQRNIYIYPAITQPNEPKAIVEQMHGSYSPIASTMLQANIQFQFPDWQLQPIIINGFSVSRQPINHPNGGMAYLISCDNKTVAYVTDNELNFPNPVVTISQWISIVSDVDLLIHDGQYVASDMPLKFGWGHSLISESLDLAVQAKVKNLAIYSHDPERTDDELDQLQAEINNMNQNVNAFLSMEGQVVQL
ncbi:MBL fold metallo-hydrolase [Colwellia sp. BRX10-3]|uniref:MBL fold metallo-hydrolase n=1 Tax=Colwellia sp. BRX10-3 TaxID=2759844 RepID=UPI0015F58A5B|nr:MBL fold metallo-hydrolase [Colwellia sp. BRX10-3]MBA6391509.1 MBL fold metallo-hydrolase [Colwellia sp. BRX10-3]